MKLRNTIIVLVLLAIVGGYAFIIGNYSKPEGPKLALGVKAANMESIDLRSADRDLTIQREKGGDWLIVKPKRAAADKSECQNLANAIANCNVESTIDRHPKDLARFGLKNPQTTVTVTTFDKKPHPGIEVGKTTPIGFHAYIKLTDKPAVMLTSSAFPTGMNKTFNDLRSRVLMTFKPGDVNQLLLANDSGRTIEFDRHGDKFQMVKPAAYPADSERVNGIISTLSNTRVANFISDTPANVTQYGLEKPRFTAAVVLDNGERQSLLFGFQQTGGSGVYVRRGESVPVYTVGEWELNSLNVPPLEFHSKEVLNGFKQPEVESVAVTNGGGKFTLQRTGAGKWNVIESGKTESGDASAIDRFVARIHGMRAMSAVADPVTDPAAYGLDQPTLQIALAGKGGKAIGEVMFSPHSPKSSEPSTPGGERTDYYAESSSGKAVFEISSYAFRQIDRPASAYVIQVAPATPAAKPAPGKK